MGNDLSKCCVNVDLANTEMNQLKFLVDKTKSKPNKEKKVILIQSSFRRIFAINRFKNLIVSVQKEIFENFGRTVEEDEIKNRRGKNLIRIEEDFKDNYSEGIKLKKYFNDSKINPLSTRENKMKKMFKAICFKSTFDIYEGFWEFEHKDDLFMLKRSGYGSLYLVDGTKIEGIWSGDSIINEGVIYHNNGKIYIGNISTIFDGDILKYKENGEGYLYYFKDHILKQTITGVWKMGILSGECIIDNFEKFTVKCEINDGQINHNQGLFRYNNGSVYEGQFNNSLQKHGYGKIIYPNGEKYEGNWKNDKYHGEGVFIKPKIELKFIPNENLNHDKDAYYKNFLSNNTNNSNENGIITKSTWVEGMLHGKGFVYMNNKISENFWRYGKLIKSICLLGSKKVEFHENIFPFLTFEEKIQVMKLNNKKINLGLSKINQFFDLLKLYKLGSIDVKSYPLLENKNKSKKLVCNFNKYILDNLNKITNLKETFDNYYNHSISFLPIVGFYTNGGTIQKRLHYSNSFTPDLKSAYSTNYLYQKKNDIIISGVINPDMIEKNQDSLRISLRRNHNEDLVINNLLQSSSQKLIQFEELRKEYKCDLNKLSITDVRILDKCLNNPRTDCLFTVHKIIIDCPIKLSLYTILGNPVKTLAVYTYDKLSENFKDTIKETFISEFNPLDKTENLENLVNKLKPSFNPIKIDNNERNIVIEFDTQEQFSKNPEDVRLLALIVLKDYNKPHLISFKKYYHLGRFITLKLIDQSTFYNYKKSGIDLGTALFYGEIFKLTK